jgi:insulysin
LQNQFEDDDFIKAIQTLTLDDLRKYERSLYGKIFITGVVYGNWTDEKINESIAILLAELKGQPLPEAERFKQIITVLPDGESVQFSPKVEDDNNAILYTLQAGPRELTRGARILMVSSLIESEFFTQMRTNQQLGYIVHAHPERIENRLFFRFIIQSASYGPFELNRRIESWFAETGKIFTALTDEEFEKHRAGLIVSLEKEGDSIAQVADDLYHSATDEKGDFKRKYKLINEVKKLSKQDVAEFARELFLDKKTSRSITLVRSNKNKDKVPDGVITELPQLLARKKIQP